jgi:hypothetical protein
MIGTVATGCEVKGFRLKEAAGLSRLRLLTELS